MDQPPTATIRPLATDRSCPDRGYFTEELMEAGYETHLLPVEPPALAGTEHLGSEGPAGWGEPPPGDLASWTWSPPSSTFDEVVVNAGGSRQGARV